MKLNREVMQVCSSESQEICDEPQLTRALLMLTGHSLEEMIWKQPLLLPISVIGITYTSVWLCSWPIRRMNISLKVMFSPEPIVRERAQFVSVSVSHTEDLLEK